MTTKKTKTTVEEETDDAVPLIDPAPTEENEDGEEVCSVCGRKGRPPGHH